MAFQGVIRKASRRDQDRIAEFQLAMALETEKLTLDPDTCRKGVAAVFEQPHLGEYYVAEGEGQVVGCLLIVPEWSDWRNGMVWWIHSVYVLPAMRGQGIYAQMYRFIQKQGEGDLREARKIRGLRLYVDKTNTSAQKVYQKLGMSNHHYELYEWMGE